MDCEIFNNLISSYVDGEIDEESLNALMLHISECPHCLKIISSHKLLKSFINNCMCHEEGDLKNCLCDRVMKQILSLDGNLDGK